MSAYLTHINYYLPETILTNQELSNQFDDWTPEKVESKVGIKTRHLAAPDESSVDMAYEAAEKLFTHAPALRDSIDFVLFCTQSPAYVLPSSACVLQDRLKLSTHIGALDFDLGCSGYVYGLALAKGMIASGQAKNILLITAEKYSQYIKPEDRGLRTLFGDGATASIISDQPKGLALSIGDVEFGTDGSGANGLMVEQGGDPHLHMDGPGILLFTLKEVPKMIEALLAKSGESLDSIDQYVFHQANSFILEKLRDKIGIAPEKFVIDVADYGNTVSSTIPIALKNLADQGELGSPQKLMLVGFGVGLSWAACLLQK